MSVAKIIHCIDRHGKARNEREERGGERVWWEKGMHEWMYV